MWVFSFVFGFGVLPESNRRPRDWQSRALTNWASFTSSRMLFISPVLQLQSTRQMSLLLLSRGGRSLSILLHRLGHVLVEENWTTEGNFGTREMCEPGKSGFTCKKTVFGEIFDYEISIMRVIPFNVSNLILWQPIPLGVTFSNAARLFQSSKLEARTSLWPRFSEKSRSSFELWALKELLKMSPHVGLAVYTFDHSDWRIRTSVCTKNPYIFALVGEK